MLPYKVKIGVCSTDRIVYDPIEYYDYVYAIQDGVDDVLLLPSGNLRPGCIRGGVYIISKKKMNNQERNLTMNNPIPSFGDSKDVEMKYRNHYKCDAVHDDVVCGTEWMDEWDSMCDDRCPACNTSTSPHESEELCLECGEVLKGFMHNCNGSSNMPEINGCPMCDDHCPLCND